MKKILLLIIAQSVFSTAHSQNSWTQKADFAGAARRSAAGFSIGSFGYLGTGYNSNFYDDLWRYDPVTDVWSQMAAFPGAARFSAVAFVISQSAYVGTGYDVNNNFNTRDFWRYDVTSNSWSQSASMPVGQERRYACAFSAQGRGYVATGAGPGGYLNDLWEYDGGSNSWTQKTNFPGAPRYECVAFSIGEYGYVACGAFAGTIYQDFYEYQPQNDVWVQRANYPGTGGDAAAGFSLEGRGYIGTGSTQGTFPVDFYEWDQSNDMWTAKASFPAPGRAFGSGFSILNKGYIGLGESTNYFNDWWEYTPDSLFSPVNENHSPGNEYQVVVSRSFISVLMTRPSHQIVRLAVFDTGGRKVFESTFSSQAAFVETDLPGGIYVYSLSSAEDFLTGKVIVH